MSDAEQPRTLAPWARALIGALGFGLGLGLASAPLGWHGLQWVGLLPLLWAWEPLGKRASCLAGLAAGFAAQLALFTWLAPAFEAYAEASTAVAWLGFFLYALWEALPFGILGLLDWASRRRCPELRWLLFAAALVGLEWLWPRVFAWRAGAPQVQATWIAPLASILGPLGLTLLVAIVNAGLYASLRGRQLLPAAVAGGSVAFGVALAAALPRPGGEPDLRIGWVQPGLVSRRGEDSAQVWAALERGCREVGAAGGAELCVLPEGISPEAWLELDASARPEGRDPRWEAWERRLARQQRAWLARVRGLARAARAPVLIGVTRRFVVPEGQSDLRVTRRTNACALVGPEGLREWTGKRRLLPFAEELPSELLRPLVPQAGRYSPAEGSGVLRLESGAEVGVLVCYEAIWARPFAARAPDVIVNPTNDDWFTGQGPALHAMLCRLRAFESGRPLVRVAATGVSFVQPARGRASAWAEAGPAAGVVAFARAQGQTPSSRMGTPWAPCLGLLALVLPLASGSSSRPRKRSAEEREPA